MQANEHLRFLDGWRGLAILLVLAGHFGNIRVFNAGGFGVELFFVLSGRLMALILVERQQPLRVFARRRLARLWPVMLVFCTCMAVLSIIVPFDGRWVVDRQAWVRGVFGLANNENVLGNMPHGMGHLWSVSVEVQAYVALALIVFVSARLKVVNVAFLALAVSIACMLLGLWLASQGAAGHDLYWRGEVRIAPVLGSFAFYLLMRGKALHPALAPAGLVAAALLQFTVVPEWVQYTLGTWLLIISVNALDGSYKSVRGFFSQPALTWLGVMSYSIYIWQQPFYMQRWAFGWLPMLTCAVCVALISYYLVERPGRVLINHWPMHRKAQSSV